MFVGCLETAIESEKQLHVQENGTRELCIWIVSIYDPAAATSSKGLTDHRIRADLEAIRPISSQIPKHLDGISKNRKLT